MADMSHLGTDEARLYIEPLWGPTMPLGRLERHERQGRLARLPEGVASVKAFACIQGFSWTPGCRFPEDEYFMRGYSLRSTRFLRSWFARYGGPVFLCEPMVGSGFSVVAPWYRVYAEDVYDALQSLDRSQMIITGQDTMKTYWTITVPVRLYMATRLRVRNLRSMEAMSAARVAWIAAVAVAGS